MEKTVAEIHEEYLDKVYQKAIEAGVWTSLIPFPRLLFRWQYHRGDVIRIATIASHRLGVLAASGKLKKSPIYPGQVVEKREYHKWCETQEKCKTVEDFINKHDYKSNLFDEDMTPATASSFSSD